MKKRVLAWILVMLLVISGCGMTEKQIEIIKLILENDNVEQAVLTFADIISFVSKQHVTNQQQAVADQQLSHQAIPTIQ